MNLRSHDLNIPKHLNDIGKASQQQTKTLSFPIQQNLDENGVLYYGTKQAQQIQPSFQLQNHSQTQLTYPPSQNQGYYNQAAFYPNTPFNQPSNIQSQNQLQNFDYQINQLSSYHNSPIQQNQFQQQQQWSQIPQVPQVPQSPIQFIQTQPFHQPLQQPQFQPIPQIKPPLIPLPTKQLQENANKPKNDNSQKSKKENRQQCAIDPMIQLEQQEKQQEQEMLSQHAQRYLQQQAQKIQSSQLIKLYQDPSFLAKLSNQEDVQAILNYCLNIKQNIKEILHPKLIQEVIEYNKPKPLPFPRESPLKAPKVPFRYQASKIRINQQDEDPNLKKSEKFISYTSRTSQSTLSQISMKRFGSSNQTMRQNQQLVGREWIRSQLLQSCRYMVRVSLKFGISDRIFENFFHKEYIVQTSQKLKQDCLTEFVHSELNISQWGLDDLMKNSQIALLSDSKDFLAKQAEYELFISNTSFRPKLPSQYIYQPSEEVINQMSQVQLEKVQGFLIANDHGSVYFDEAVDLTYADLSTTIHIGEGYFELYPLTANRSHHLIPYPGAKLNKSCTVTLDIPIETLQLFYDQVLMDLDHTKIKNYLASDCQAKGYKMVNYDKDEKIFSFRTCIN